MTSTSYPGRLPQRPSTRTQLRRSHSVPNQMLFREVNEQIYLRREPFDRHDGEIAVVCECERRDCSKSLRISLERYEEVRRFPTRFVMKPGHAVAEDERVVEEQDGFVVVEKTGPSARIAIRLNPRNRRQVPRPAA